MAKMKLYYSPSSPYARKVRVVAMETGLDKKIEMVNVALTPVAPNADVDKHNPIGKIPEYKYCAVRIDKAQGDEPRGPTPDINVTASGL